MGLIRALRRKAAAMGLVLLLGQSIAVGAAMVRDAGTVLGISDCCAKGSHPPGLCPLHRRAQRSSTCRLSCAASTGGPAVLISVTSLSLPAALVEPTAVRLPFFDRAASALETTSVSPTPPPRS